MKTIEISTLFGATDPSQKQIRKSAKAQKSLKKAKRKLRRALRASNLVEMEIAIGMAKCAIAKAKFVASAKLR